MQVKEILRNNKTFLLPYLLFLITGAVLLFCFPKGELHLWLNRFHNSILDTLFTYVTWLGDLITPLTIGIILLFIRYRYALILLTGNLLAATITQLLKHTLFSDVVRPKMFFEGTTQLKFVDGVENWLYNSFPSGHTTSAFATFFCLALLTGSHLNKFIFFTIALSVAYSRIYLSQHFFDDIYAGSLVGFTCITVTYLFFIRSTKKWMDNSLVQKRS